MNKTNKETFLLYNSYRVMIDELPDADAGILCKAIFALAAGENINEKELPLAVKVVLAFISQQMEKDDEKYNNRCAENRKNAEKRWSKKATLDEVNAAESEEVAPEDETCEDPTVNENGYKDMRPDAMAYHNDYDNDYVNDNDFRKEKDSYGVQKEIHSLPTSLATEIPLNDGTTYHVPESDLREYQALYPQMDVLHEIWKAARWSRENPEKRKTRRGVKRFIGGWLSRADSGCKDFNHSQGGTAPKRKNAFHNFDQRDFDYDSMMRSITN